MTDIEAAGDVATGAIIAREVEAAEGKNDGNTHEAACLNCGAVLKGAYCADCGQRAHVHRTLTALGHDLAHSVFHFEGKVWRTLPMLAWWPGEVTRRYIHGERARFVSPMALFLFSVFLMFAVFSSVGGPISSGRTNTRVEAGPNATERREMASALADARARLASLEQARREAVARGDETKAIDTELEDARSDVRALSVPALFGDKTSRAGVAADIGIDTGSKALDDKLRSAIADPNLLLYKLQSSAYKFAWALIPISLPFMWLMFAWRREYRLYDHAVFVTFSLSSVVLLLVLMALAAAIAGPSEWLLFLVPVHFYRQLKQAYRLTTVGALWRTTVLLAMTSIVLTVFGLFLLTLGLSG